MRIAKEALLGYCQGTWNVADVPMQGSGRVKTIPLVVAQEAYKEYAMQYGTGQSLEQIGERGGFGAVELITLLYARIRRIQGELEK